MCCTNPTFDIVEANFGRVMIIRSPKLNLQNAPWVSSLRSGMKVRLLKANRLQFVVTGVLID